MLVPKYYIRDNNDLVVIDAGSPVLACARALINRKLQSILVGGYYWVSERGFSPHLDDLDQKVSSDEVNDVAMQIFYENPDGIA